MTLNELRYVIAIANEKSFGRAAVKCGISQPALSIAVQKLEEELGILLFERNKNVAVPTPIGERIVEQAQKVIEDSICIKEIADTGKNQLRGPLKLGVIFTVAPYLLPDLIPALIEIAPDMPLDLEENFTENLGESLRTGRIDAAIVALPFSPPGVISDLLYEEPFQIVMPRGHKWAKRKDIDAGEIAGENPILLNVGHCFRDQVLEACPELNAHNRSPRTNSLETIRNMVASGLGISVLPRDALVPKYHSNLIVSIPFAKPIPFRHIALAYRKSFPREKAITMIRSAAVACRQQS